MLLSFPKETSNLYYKTSIIKTSSSSSPPTNNSDPNTENPKPSQADPTKDDDTGRPNSTPPGSVGATSSPTVSSAASPVKTTLKTTTKKPEDLMCTIAPSSGTVFDAFTITCSTKLPCHKCLYCFTAKGTYLPSLEVFLSCSFVVFKQFYFLKITRQAPALQDREGHKGHAPSSR